MSRLESVEYFCTWLDESIAETHSLFCDVARDIEHRKNSFESNQDLMAARRMLEVFAYIYVIPLPPRPDVGVPCDSEARKA